MLAGALIHRLYRLCYNAPHWRCGWRRLTGPDLIDLGRHPEAGWSVLPDDGRRFYAEMFTNSNSGYAAAIVVLLMIAITPVLVYQVRQFRREEAAR